MVISVVISRGISIFGYNSMGNYQYRLAYLGIILFNRCLSLPQKLRCSLKTNWTYFSKTYKQDIINC